MDFSHVRSLIGRSSTSFLSSLHLSPGLKELTVEVPEWREGSLAVSLVYGVCVDRAFEDESEPSASSESSG